MDAHHDTALMGFSWLFVDLSLYIYIYIYTFFVHPVYALVPDPSWSFMDAI